MKFNLNFCDRCKATIKQVSGIRLEIHFPRLDQQESEIELCVSCAKQLRDFLAFTEKFSQLCSDQTRD